MLDPVPTLETTYNGLFNIIRDDVIQLEFLIIPLEERTQASIPILINYSGEVNWYILDAIVSKRKIPNFFRYINYLDVFISYLKAVCLRLRR